MLSYFGWGSKSTSTPSEQQQQPQPQNDPIPPPPQQQLQQQRQPPSGIPTSLKLLAGGMTFFAFSLLITRRSMNKKRLASIPPYYTGAMYHKPNVNGAMEAFEALNLATINVMSFGMMFAGGVLYKLDINGIEDARTYVRAGLGGGDGPVKSDEELEQDIGEWIMSVMGKKAQKEFLEKKAEFERQKQERENSVDEK
ncbi:hypothetical protein ASPWEDRAFT_173517 [Aspergillus wentii DTO 134E9]|uniref:Altered inheritance of mitochondria protein 11 n=1 Tax=Aspergillus wentii DTO 134E9 TaxID=1073089 RepID=A0A1L9RGN4_ASPWE|nr:uncharacterized protein ASPWEDRAFT_173517 [Aspergillus wentii DTO 134E9]KAI9927866.1 hypothetical protein MW887_002718 [Aspergillus wentii]OJJ34085.1 hypothetical protein ASPWEDRAFT_173517 [Aspergillus wentii DTO 134E9]